MFVQPLPRDNGAVRRGRIAVLVLLAVIGGPAAAQPHAAQPSDAIGQEHLLLGCPLPADTTTGHLIRRAQYVLSYNRWLNAANWVSWELRDAWYGPVRRKKGAFMPDPLLPPTFPPVRDRDYRRSGYDRGHMVRSEERTATVEDNRSTFYLTNVLPQHPRLNQQPWLALENWCMRACTERRLLLLVTAGGVFHDPVRRVGGMVAIPDSCFKIIVVLSPGEGPEDVSTETPVIAVMMPNDGSAAGRPWTAYITTVDRIEASTGWDFLPAVPDDIETRIEARAYHAPPGG